jgi:hypothetical protein
VGALGEVGCHSITSVACARTVCGMVRPSALAVFRLMDDPRGPRHRVTEWAKSAVNNGGWPRPANPERTHDPVY